MVLFIFIPLIFLFILYIQDTHKRH
ncbi:MAG: hypothetical protein J6S85_25670 [Methanobrevibacter sp.]|nr:hypothetical protein [Methanobrevibacter sp.]